jgi:hypothetical protein
VVRVEPVQPTATVALLIGAEAVGAVGAFSVPVLTMELPPALRYIVWVTKGDGVGSLPAMR